MKKPDNFVDTRCTGRVNMSRGWREMWCGYTKFWILNKTIKPLLGQDMFTEMVLGLKSEEVHDLSMSYVNTLIELDKDL